MTDREQLQRLVKLGNQFRRTPVVDDDFPAYRNAFDHELDAATKLVETPRRTIVCLCGSTRFYEEFQKANYRETMAGKIVLSVGFYPHSSETAHGETVGCTSVQKEALDELHLRKIDIADEVLILNVRETYCPACGHFRVGTRNGRTSCCDAQAEARPYIGESTARELAYAKARGIPIRYLEPLAARDADRAGGAR